MPLGRHFLQIPGPTNVPDRVLRAIAQPTIDHRGPAFGLLGREVLDGLQRVFQTSRPVTLPCCGATWPYGSACRWTSFPATGATASIRPSSNRSSLTIAAAPSR